MLHRPLPLGHLPRRPNHLRALLRASPCRSTGPAVEAAPDVSALLLEAYEPGRQPLPRFVGPIKIVMLPGKGRGIVATSRIKPGDLVLATPPLAVLFKPGAQPDVEDFIDHVLEQGHYKSRWFDVLYDGTAKSAAATLPRLQPSTPSIRSASGQSADPTAVNTFGLPEPDLPAASTSTTPAKPKSKPVKASSRATLGKNSPRGFGGGTAAVAGTGGATAAVGAAAGALVETSSGTASGTAVHSGTAIATALSALDARTKRRVASVCVKNCFGDEQEDLAMVACRGETVNQGHTGLWPEFSFFNHACAPNTINYAAKGTMVVRAVAPIKEGDEVTISYLGRPQLSPLAARRAALLEGYGFECKCQRCLDEEANEEKVQPAMDELLALLSTEDGHGLPQRLLLAQRKVERAVADAAAAAAAASALAAAAAATAAAATAAAAAAAAAARPTSLEQLSDRAPEALSAFHTAAATARPGATAAPLASPCAASLGELGDAVGMLRPSSISSNSSSDNSSSSSSSNRGVSDDVASPCAASLRDSGDAGVSITPGGAIVSASVDGDASAAMPPDEAAETRLAAARLELLAVAEEGNDAVQAAVQRLYAAFRRSLLSPRVRQYMCASVFSAFELLADCQQLLGLDCSASLAACVKAVAAVTAGSDLHVILAARQLTVAQAAVAAAAAAAAAGSGGGSDDDADAGAAAAAAAAAAAIPAAAVAAFGATVSRYGQVDKELMGRLILYNGTLYE